MNIMSHGRILRILGQLQKIQLTEDEDEFEKVLDRIEEVI